MVVGPDQAHVFKLFNVVRYRSRGVVFSISVMHVSLMQTNTVMMQLSAMAMLNNQHCSIHSTTVPNKRLYSGSAMLIHPNQVQNSQ